MIYRILSVRIAHFSKIVYLIRLIILVHDRTSCRKESVKASCGRELKQYSKNDIGNNFNMYLG